MPGNTEKVQDIPTCHLCVASAGAVPAPLLRDLQCKALKGEFRRGSVNRAGMTFLFFQKRKCQCNLPAVCFYFSSLPGSRGSAVS